MPPDDITQQAVQHLVKALQLSVDTSPYVRSAVENLQNLGYIPSFTVRMDLELSRPMDSTLTDTKVRVA